MNINDICYSACLTSYILLRIESQFKGITNAVNELRS